MCVGSTSQMGRRENAQDRSLKELFIFGYTARSKEKKENSGSGLCFLYVLRNSARCTRPHRAPHPFCVFVIQCLSFLVCHSSNFVGATQSFSSVFGSAFLKVFFSVSCHCQL